MTLIWDIGNTSLRAAWLTESGLRLAWQTQYRESGILAALAACPLTETPTRSVAACVAGSDIRTALQQWAQRRWGIDLDFCHSRAMACGVRNAYAEPQRLGIDRWLGVLAAHQRLQNGRQPAALIVNAGTALTLDVVTLAGQHLGGLIAPGIGTQRRSLLGATQIRAREDRNEVDWLGRSTEAAVGFGTLQSALGLIERVHRGVQSTQGTIGLRLIAGGEAALLQPHLDTTWQSAPDLVLEGLAHWLRGDPSTMFETADW